MNIEGVKVGDIVVATIENVPDARYLPFEIEEGSEFEVLEISDDDLISIQLRGRGAVPFHPDWFVPAQNGSIVPNAKYEVVANLGGHAFEIGEIVVAGDRGELFNDDRDAFYKLDRSDYWFLGADEVELVVETNKTVWEQLQDRVQLCAERVVELETLVEEERRKSADLRAELKEEHRRVVGLERKIKDLRQTLTALKRLPVSSPDDSAFLAFLTETIPETVACRKIFDAGRASR